MCYLSEKSDQPGYCTKATPYGKKSFKDRFIQLRTICSDSWLRFVPENSSIIARGAADLAYKRIEPHLSDYMRKVFEEICKQYLWQLQLNGESLVEFNDLGHWWETIRLRVPR